MSGFLGLVQNENMKIYRRPRTWILMAVILACVIGGALITKQALPQVGGDQWEHKAQQELKNNQKTLNKAKDMPDQSKEQLQKQSAKLSYDLKHNINPYEKNNWSFVNFAGINIVFLLVTLFVIIVASDIVAGEFTWGTVKMLMIRPHPRWSILLSKYTASIIFGIVLLLELLISSWIMGGLIYGFGSFDYASYSADATGEVTKHVESLATLKAYGLRLLTIFFIMTISFMLSTIFRSGGLAIGIGILVYFSMNSLGGLLIQYDWAKYLIFLNVDLTQYTNSSEGLMEGMTLPFSIGIDAGYWLIFVIITWWIFQKRDIAT